MRLQLPHNLHYPITINKLLKQSNDRVARLDGLFEYTYRYKHIVQNEEEEDVEEISRGVGTFDSSIDGTLLEWRVKVGAEFVKPGAYFVEIEEDCLHEVQYNGMCVNCGRDMNEVSYTTEELDTSRASIRMTHDNSALTVSQGEATRVEEEAKRRLLASKKLTLVVDLDQTIIHATVDPTVAEWQQDKDNPNYEAVKDVKAFQLIDDGPSRQGCWYYIKLRPGLAEFLQNISKLYELHIYTMGTRLYAENIREIVDPSRQIFGDRILSRDESGSLTAKNLQRLFPIDTKMVVIIDDRGDVWKWNDNLVKVSPYDFFVGIGDINSSFLPKKQDVPVVDEAQLKATPNAKKETREASSETDAEPKKNGAEDPSLKKEELSALEQLVTMGGGDDPKLLEIQTHDQEIQIAAQMEARPLLQMQKKLDAEDEAAEASSNGEKPENREKDVSLDPGKHRHNLLQDNDTELTYLEERLSQVHQAFFDEYDRKRAGSQGGRLSALRGEQKAPVSEKGIDLSLVPDVKIVMPSIKRQVLHGAVLVLSGVVPLGADVQNADISLWAKSFGAKIQEKITKQTTHVVAGRNRTAKVRQAAKRPHILIVTVQWLQDSVTQWKWLEEEPYLVNVHPDDRQGLPSSGASPQGSKDGLELDGNGEPGNSGLSTDEDTGVSTDEEGPSSALPKLVLKTRTTNNGPADEPTLSNIDLESPIGGSPDDWAAMRDELDEFMGSGDESDSDASVMSNLSQRLKKRKRDDDEPEDGENEENDEDQEGSDLSKKIKRSHARSTGLKAVHSIDSPNGSRTETPDENLEEVVEGRDDVGDDDEEEDDLEAALERALQEDQ